METISNVASYDLYVAEGSGSYAKIATIPSSTPQFNFEGKSNTTYFFRSIARDHAGNVESKAVTAEATTYVPDLDAPVTLVDAVQSTTPNFQISVRGTDIGGSGLTRFKVFVSVDNAVAIQIAELGAGQPDSQGIYRTSVSYQALADGANHSYRFFALGIDQAGNKEPDKVTGDLVINKTFPSPAQLSATGIDVQRGQKQRSYIRHVDLFFNSEIGIQSILSTLSDAQTNNDRIRLQRFNTDGSGPGVSIALQGLASQNGRSVELNFGSSGLGSSPSTTAGNGYYRLSVDNDGDGQMDQMFHFYRLLGDTNSDRIVNTLDVRDIATAISRKVYDPNLDVNGDGVIDLRDRNLAIGHQNSSISATLPLDD
jgi:hypothetical protein